MTFYVMAPTFDRAWQDGVQPLMENKISEQEAFGRITEPFRDFMLAQVRDKDLQLFADLARRACRSRPGRDGTAPPRPTCACSSPPS